MISTRIRITHLTTVHKRLDIRIFQKECRSLSAAGFQTSLVVADGNGNEQINGITFYDVGSWRSRFDRISRIAYKVLKQAILLNSDIFHIHDPELIPIGILLKRVGKRVIFDAHEDFPKQVLSKPYLGKFSSSILSNIFALFERTACRKYDAIIAATPFIGSKFSKINKETFVINNYPFINEFAPNTDSYSDKQHICYVGDITEIRGIKQIVAAMAQINCKLILAGHFDDYKLENDLKAHPGWQKIIHLGYLDRENLRKVFLDSFAGLVLFLPEPNHVDAQPNKLFEYMSASLPVISSNFPLWKEIIEGHNCGICVDPTDSMQIASAINLLITYPNKAKAMGINGRLAIEKFYNWNSEEKILIRLYNALSES